MKIVGIGFGFRRRKQISFELHAVGLRLMRHLRYVIPTCRLLEETLTLISQTAKSVDAYVHDATANFWKAFLSKQYEIIEKVGTNLPFTVPSTSVMLFLIHSYRLCCRVKL